MEHSIVQLKEFLYFRMLKLRHLLQCIWFVKRRERRHRVFAKLVLPAKKDQELMSMDFTQLGSSAVISSGWSFYLALVQEIGLYRFLQSYHVTARRFQLVCTIERH
ncbi:hypothetical protein KP509_1Z092300 [Ceratopteris richardii]|nr:hypothetical protein KP509_1Z092300 [Ceratopteris richardii]